MTMFPQDPPPGTPPGPPPGVPPQQPQWRQPPPTYPPPREGRSASFFVAIFLGILLMVSGALNVLLLVISVGSFASAGLGGLSGEEDGGAFDVVRVGGESGASVKVLRIPINGAIAEAQNPVLGASGGTVTQVRRALRYAEGDGSIGGILLDIDSPGGGVTDSDEIYRMLKRYRDAHPKVRVLALFGDLAASGGYYVAAAAEHIMARRTSITGSIGVIMSAWNFTEAAKKLGVDQIAIKSPHTPFKDILSPTRPMRDDERALLEGIVEELYQQFVDVVAAGRPKLTRDDVLALATGAIYTAGQARQNGLVDEIGDRVEAENWFRNELGPVQVIECRRRAGLRDLLFGARAPAPPTLAEAAGRLLTAGTGPRFLYFWAGGR
jgi:protease-4